MSNPMRWTLKYVTYKGEVKEHKSLAPTVLEAIRRANLQGYRILSAEPNRVRDQ